MKRLEDITKQDWLAAKAAYEAAIAIARSKSCFGGTPLLCGDPWDGMDDMLRLAWVQGAVAARDAFSVAWSRKEPDRPGQYWAARFHTLEATVVLVTPKSLEERCAYTPNNQGGTSFSAFTLWGPRLEDPPLPPPEPEETRP